VTQEFHLSVTPIRDHDYLVRTEHVAPGVPLAEEQVTWYVDDWLTEASLLMGDPVIGLLRSSSAANGFSRRSSHRGGATHEPSANLVAFGQQLFNALFQGTIRDSWMMAQGIAQHQHHRLRFRLGLKGTQLHRLPWEVLYAGDRPLATGTDVIFSRYHSSFSVLKSHLTPPKPGGDLNQPLKILLVLSAPSDQDVLALKQEAEQLRQELQTVAEGNGNRAAIELTILEQPGREDLTQALEHNHFQVLHYAGHSDLSAAGGSLYLVNKRTGLTEVMSGEDLAGLLVNNGIRMAVFNSCRGVYTATSASGQTSDGNLAESLVRRGIPAVLAMAERIPDNVALNLSRLFYRNLKQAYPLDLSLSRTRQGLISSYGSDQLYWALPILYLHPEFDGFLQPTTQPSDFVQTSFVPNYSDFYTSSDLLSFAVEDPIASNGRSHPDSQTESSERSLTNESFPDFDALEFDDPDPPEEEQVAQLVYELSENPTLLEPEDPGLSALLTKQESPDLPPNGNLSQERFEATVHRTGSVAARNGNEPVASVNPVVSVPPTAMTEHATDTRVYSELAAVLADMGTLTDEIASSNRVVQENPNSAEAYTNLGWALYQQGYLTEAISAYNQAIRLNPAYADAFNRLGLAFLQQGKVDEAVRAYSQAVKLDPTMTEASTNLRNALSEQDPPLRSTASAPVSRPQPPTPPKTRSNRSIWLWSGLGAIVLATLAAGWTYREALIKQILPSPSQPSSNLPSPPSDATDLLAGLAAETLANLATEQLQQGKITEAEATIEALLNQPNSLQTVEQVLQAVPAQFADQPTIAFLQGRLIWQQWIAGEQGAKVETARQLWDKSAQAEPTPTKYNAIGFAYYSEGNPDRAEQAWLTALRSLGSAMNGQATSDPDLTPEKLTTYAGLALTAIKLAEQQPITQQATSQKEAIERRQLVLERDQDGFQPEALRQNWMWSETAIRDWEKLLKL
jgi:tetratricopeptide (TPR) repeat protein